jgi:hypothetical protein
MQDCEESMNITVSQRKRNNMCAIKVSPCFHASERRNPTISNNLNKRNDSEIIICRRKSKKSDDYETSSR